MTPAEPPQDGAPPARDVLSSLPRTRPQRPSRRRAQPAPAGPKSKAKKPARATGAGKAKPRAARPDRRASRPTRPAGVRPSAATRAARDAPSPKRPERPPSGTELVGTAVQAVGELAQLGLTLGTRALRDVVSRLPRP